jgi:hypothetical protein
VPEYDELEIFERGDWKPSTRTIATDLSKFPTCFYMYGKEGIKITPEGDIFWKGKEIESDDDFKLAMIDLKNCLMGRR